MSKLPLCAVGLAAFFACGAAALAATSTAQDSSSPPAGNADTDNPAETANAARSYDSDYNHANKAMSATSGNTPEDDGRPGEYYFKLGAYAFEHKDFAHAAEMYKVAASWADKTAEFNLAVMYARGQGVPVDMPRAMAWIALAAERGDARYVETREVIYSNLSKEQFDQSNVVWRELKKTYGDDVALTRAKARWHEVRTSMTGSHVGAIGNLQVSGAVISGPPPADSPAGASVGTHREAKATFQLTGGNQQDASIAYRQLRESDNPYDPKFERAPVGTVSVRPLEPVKDDGKTPEAGNPAQDPKHD
jgi:hypothetical protein